jgi:hypothetical protein
MVLVGFTLLKMCCASDAEEMDDLIDLLSSESEESSS